jgi:hypothetical protein
MVKIHKQGAHLITQYSHYDKINNILTTQQKITKRDIDHHLLTGLFEK